MWNSNFSAALRGLDPAIGADDASRIADFHFESFSEHSPKRAAEEFVEQVDQLSAALGYGRPKPTEHRHPLRRVAAVAIVGMSLLFAEREFVMVCRAFGSPVHWVQAVRTHLTNGSARFSGKMSIHGHRL